MQVLNIGQKLSIFFPKNNNVVEMVCSIAEIMSDRIVVNLPQYFMRYIEFLDVGCQLTVKVFSKVGTLDFNTVVLSSPAEEEFSIELDYNAIKLTPNEDIPVINAVETLNISLNGESFKVKTFEISTEFMKFYSDTEFKENSVLDCSLILPKNYGIINFRATLKEVDPIYENEYTIFDFCMTEENRQALLYYMYVYTSNTDWDE